MVTMKKSQKRGMVLTGRHDKEMRRKLFGTDGIRGVANVDPMTGEIALQLGRAVAHLFKEVKGRHRIVVGKDTRLSGYMLETALASGICSMGADAMLVGPLPIPGIAFITTSMRTNARYSGTEPLLQIMGEGKDETKLHQYVQDLVELVKKYIGKEACSCS
jgi:phosphomannomutase